MEQEKSTCPRCGNPFNCNACNITQCQCYGVKLNDATKKLIEARYTDCLCRECLEYFQQEPNVFKEKFNPDR